MIRYHRITPLRYPRKNIIGGLTAFVPLLYPFMKSDGLDVVLKALTSCYFADPNCIAMCDGTHNAENEEKALPCTHTPPPANQRTTPPLLWGCGQLCNCACASCNWTGMNCITLHAHTQKYTYTYKKGDS